MKNSFESLRLNVQVQLRKRNRKRIKKWGSTTSIKKWGNGVMGKKKKKLVGGGYGEKRLNDKALMFPQKKYRMG